MFSLSKYPLMQTKIINVYENIAHYEAILTPLEKNFSSSFANLLRKMILSYSIGFGVVGVKIKNVNSEFDSIPGIVEDTVQVLINLKNIVISSNLSLETTQKLKIKEKGPKTIYADSIKTPHNIEILNKYLKICTINDNSDLDIEIIIQSGIGYYQHSGYIQTNLIPLDTSFSPVSHVSYAINSYPNYEELAFHIKTNGSVPAKEVFYHSLDLLKRRISMLV